MSIGLSTRVALGLALAFAALVFSMGGSPPKAAANTTDCEPGWFCVWDGPTMGGFNHLYVAGSDPYNLRCYHLSFEAQSARNHTGNHTMCFGASCVGPGGEIDLNNSRPREVCMS